MSGLDPAARCPECGGQQRLPTSTRAVWSIEWDREKVQICAAALVLAPLVCRFSTVAGGTARYMLHEPFSAALSNASMGSIESIRVAPWTPFVGLIAALAAVWWRGKAAYFFLFASLVLLAIEGVPLGYQNPAVHRMDARGGGVAAGLAALLVPVSITLRGLAAALGVGSRPRS